jgi:hypothetical protein
MGYRRVKLKAEIESRMLGHTAPARENLRNYVMKAELKSTSIKAYIKD